MLSLFTIMRRKPRAAGLGPGEVMLTFDDGPNLVENVTPRLLDVLHHHKVKAGFCLIGQQVRQHPAVVRRMFRSGHLLINHTETHQHPIRQNYSTLRAEVEACDQAFRDVLHIADYRSQYFRAPFGIVTPAVRRVTRALKMIPVLLTHYAWDTRVGPHNYQSVVDLLIKNAKQHRGGLYVFHDGTIAPSSVDGAAWQKCMENRSWVPDAVHQVVTALKRDGLKFILPGAREAAHRDVSGTKAA